MSLLSRLNGLYVITNDEPFDVLMAKLRVVVTFPCVRVLQYRRKQVDISTQCIEAQQVQQLCLAHGVDFIINDDMQLAYTLSKFGSCGVHLGQGDGDIVDARKLLGSDATIGRTCHQSIELALQAQHQGASYVAFGAYRSSQSKPSAQTLEPKVWASIQQQVNIPTCVIGGVVPTDVITIASTGVDLIAVINGALAGNLDSVKRQMHQWQNEFDKHVFQ